VLHVWSYEQSKVRRGVVAPLASLVIWTRVLCHLSFWASASGRALKRSIPVRYVLCVCMYVTYLTYALSRGGLRVVVTCPS
jgi:hypothetical protein